MGISPLPASIYTTFAGHRSTCTIAIAPFSCSLGPSCNHHRSKTLPNNLKTTASPSNQSRNPYLSRQNTQLTLEGTSNRADLPNSNPNLPSTLPYFLQDDSAVTYSYFSTYRTSQVRVASFVNSFRSQVRSRETSGKENVSRWFGEVPEGGDTFPEIQASVTGRGGCAL